MTTELIAAGEAARRIGVSREYLRTLADSNRVEFQMSPYGRLYDAADVERFRVEREKRRARA